MFRDANSEFPDTTNSRPTIRFQHGQHVDVCDDEGRVDYSGVIIGNAIWDEPTGRLVYEVQKAYIIPPVIGIVAQNRMMRKIWKHKEYLIAMGRDPSRTIL